jgi:hypothetical protein
MRWYVAGCAAAITLGTAALASPARAELAVDHAVGQSDAAQNITVVVANGLGTTVESAVQNAAENALTQVVGSFVDAETQIERRTQITDGIRAETHNISNKMREYSQGSIKSFEVLDTQQDGAVVRVTAKVGVQVDVLHAQLKGALAGATTISKGLFAQAATEQTQQVNAEAIFIDRIVTPIVQGVSLQLTVGKVAKIDLNILPCTEFGTANKPQCDFLFTRLLAKFSKQEVYQIPITITADPSASEAMWQTMSSITKEPCVRLDLNSPRPFDPLAEGVERLRQRLQDGGTQRRYVSVVHRVGTSTAGLGCYQALDDVKSFDASIANFAHIAFEASVFDQEGVIVGQYIYHPYRTLQPGSPENTDTAGSPDFKRSLFLIPGGVFTFALPRTQTFGLLIDLPITVIEKAARVEVKTVID